jgi:hypothetical protein
MRTTVDLPEDVHRLATSVARDRGTTLSEAISELILRGLGVDQQPSVGVDSRTGLPVVRLGIPVSSEDVRALEDE